MGEMSDFNIVQETRKAIKRINKTIRETALEYSYYLSQLTGCHVYLKLENQQIAGSFKIRGAANLMLSLSTKEKELGVVASSSGNHGAAVAYLLDKLRVEGTIYLPENVSESKVDALRTYGAEVSFLGKDVVETERFARRIAEEKQIILIPPYNHPDIIAGQATIALELERQIKRMDVVLVPVGGGGLISGIAGYLKSLNRQIRIIGCQPQNSPVMFESLRAGKIIEMDSMPTISDGTAGGIEKDSITFDLCQEYVDEFAILTEEEIMAAMTLMLEKEYILIEGAAALPVAALIKMNSGFEDKSIILIITGKRISLDKLNFD